MEVKKCVIHKIKVAINIVKCRKDINVMEEVLVMQIFVCFCVILIVVNYVKLFTMINSKSRIKEFVSSVKIVSNLPFKINVSVLVLMGFSEILALSIVLINVVVVY